MTWGLFKMEVKLRFLNLKKHLWCRFFKSHRKCHPEVWQGGNIKHWHCVDCKPCGMEIDYMIEKVKNLE
jgi:hypothetical protein